MRHALQKLQGTRRKDKVWFGSDPHYKHRQFMQKIFEQLSIYRNNTDGMPLQSKVTAYQANKELLR